MEDGTEVVQKKGGRYFEAKPIYYKLSASFFKNNYLFLSYIHLKISCFICLE